MKNKRGNHNRNGKGSKRKGRRKKRIIGWTIFAVVLFLLIFIYNQVRPRKLSDEVLALEPYVEESAEKNGISQYENVLLAIIQVETKGEGDDVMQSSESAGKCRNSLTKGESIQQGCRHFASLVRKAKEKGCDIDTAIQAYNYGTTYIDYVSRNGGVHTEKLAIEFAREKSSGNRVRYKNVYACLQNGGWRYRYGNMFYVFLVHRYM